MPKVVTGVAIVVFWPTAFFVGGDRGNAAELGRLKGEADALEQSSRRHSTEAEGEPGIEPDGLPNDHGGKRYPE